MSLQTKLKKYIHPLLDYLEEHLHVLIIALAVLVGLLGGAKIISNGIVEANRFQFLVGESPVLFDSETGAVFKCSSTNNWWTKYDIEKEHSKIYDEEDWIEYLIWAEERTQFLNKYLKNF